VTSTCWCNMCRLSNGIDLSIWNNKLRSKNSEDPMNSLTSFSFDPIIYFFEGKCSIKRNFLSREHHEITFHCHYPILFPFLFYIICLTCIYLQNLLISLFHTAATASHSHSIYLCRQKRFTSGCMFFGTWISQHLSLLSSYHD
jgi:hypothetical protein